MQSDPQIQFVLTPTSVLQHTASWHSSNKQHAFVFGMGWEEKVRLLNYEVYEDTSLLLTRIMPTTCGKQVALKGGRKKEKRKENSLEKKRSGRTIKKGEKKGRKKKKPRKKNPRGATNKRVDIYSVEGFFGVCDRASADSLP